jgi:NitT/TauT family transport system permease protein
MPGNVSTFREPEDQASKEILRQISAAEKKRTAAWNRRIIIGRILVGLVLLGVWEVLSGPFVDPFWISEPSEILIRLATWVSTGYLFLHMGVTLWEMAVGLVLGASVGIAVGFTLGRLQSVSELLTPYIAAFFSMPRIALAPLFILWFGIGLWSKVALVFLLVFFLVFHNTFAGVRDVSPELINKVRLMGANRSQLMRKVILPSAGTWIFAGLKVAVPFSLIAAVVAEIVASNRGLGYVVEHSSGMFDTAGIFAALFVLMMIGLILNMILARIEARVLRWKIDRSSGPERR